MMRTERQAGQTQSDFFCSHFPEVVTAWMDRRRLSEELKQIKARLAGAEDAGVGTPEEQFEAARARAFTALEDAELEVLGKRGQSDCWTRPFGFWRAPLRRGNPFAERAFRESETRDMVEFAALRRKLEFAFAVEADKLKSGELRIASMTAKDKAASIEGLKARLAVVEQSLANACATLEPLQEGNRDHAEELMKQYIGSQAKTPFPVKPEQMIRTSVAWGAVISKEHPDAAQVFMADDDPRLPAWRELRAFLGGKAV